jgi:hypothetical protein
MIKRVVRDLKGEASFGWRLEGLVCEILLRS